VAKTKLVGTLLFILAMTVFLFSMENASAADVNSEISYIFGIIQDSQFQPVKGVEVTLFSGGNSDFESLSSAITQEDGSYAIKVPNPIPEQSKLLFSRHHFQQTINNIPTADIKQLQLGNSVSFPLVTLEREITPAFWIAASIFVIVLFLIATGFLHNTLAAFAGASTLLAFSYLGSPLLPDLYIFDFPQAITYIDWNVIFLIMGMMMVIAVVENTGIFHWLSYHAYRISDGKMIILLPVLMLITGISSAFLDNVTTMLLMTPITVQIALALNVSPLVLLIPEVFASNVIGVSTLIGTPTNILIGSFGNITFNDFLTNLTPGVFMAFIGLIIYSWLTYRKELTEEKSGSPLLLEKLEERGKITNPENLKKAGWIGAGMMLLFVFGEKVHLLPSVTALIGASAL